MLALPASAHAGGPGMPWQLMEDRTATLLRAPRLSFAEEVLLFVRPPGYVPPRIERRAWDRTAEDDLI